MVDTKIIPFEQFLIERQQNQLNDSFHKVDLEDATKEEVDDIKSLIQIVFGESASQKPVLPKSISKLKVSPCSSNYAND